MTEAPRASIPTRRGSGVGAVVLDGDRVLLVQRGQPPLPGEVEPARRAGRTWGSGSRTRCVAR